MSSGISTLGVKTEGNVNEQIAPIAALRPQIQVAGALNGLTIDRQRGGGPPVNSMLFKLITGDTPSAPTTVAVTMKLQHDTDSAAGTMVDATAGRAGSVVTKTIADDATDNQETMFCDLAHLNRYVRLVVTAAFTGGSTPSILVAADAITGEYLGEVPITQEAQT